VAWARDLGSFGAAAPLLRDTRGGVIQRQCAQCSEEEEASRAAPPAVQAKGEGGAVAAEPPPIVHEVLGGAAHPLDGATRAFMEARLGHDFRNVRVHTDARASESARSIGALAYTVGRDIVFRAGQYDPGSRDGKRVLAHELAHVVQQRASPPAVQRTADAGECCEMVPGEGKAAPARREEPAPGAAVVQRTPDLRLQRLYDPTDPVARMRRGLPLPYREATNYLECMRIMNDRTYCDQAVLNIPPPAPAPPPTCVPSRALTWADFTAAAPTGSPHAAQTSFNFSLVTSGGRDWVVANFDASSSWAVDKAKDPTNRAVNDCSPSACEQNFDQRTAAGQTGITFHLGASTGCAAQPQPNTTLTATTRGECSTLLAAECDRVAVLNSARLLHHEQLHLDIACVIAGKGNAAIDGGANSQQILAAVRRKANQQTTQYDSPSQSFHGCNAAGQASWDADVAAGLPRVTIP
jgi:hypothetical protein